MTSFVSFAEIFPQLRTTGTAHAEAVRLAFEAILAGKWTDVQVAGLAVALRVLGEQPEGIGAAVDVLRRAMVPVTHDLPLVFDTCGTGGDGLGSWNVSTGAALLLAAAGVPVAKHGNRAVSSVCGSADVLEALGVATDVPATKQSEVLQQVGIAFLFAPAHHPALRHGAIARRELGIRTIFNVLGPLANPARATHQLLGTYDDTLRPVVAAALGRLGVQAAWVVRGEDGLDEVSPCGPTRVSEWRDGVVKERSVQPEDFGLKPLDPAVLRGGNAAENAAMLQTVIDGQDHPARDAIVLNAAAGLVVAYDLPPRQARERIEAVLANGQARATLLQLRTATQALRSASVEKEVLGRS